MCIHDRAACTKAAYEVMLLQCSCMTSFAASDALTPCVDERQSSSVEVERCTANRAV